MSLEVLKHLGFNLYSNIPAVISEVVANSYDADATKVTITIEEDKITIKDDGHGMTLTDINNKFLLVGYQKRKDAENSKTDDKGNKISQKFGRYVMGRKGIGKLSLFSIANNIEVHSTKNGEKNGFILNRADIEKEIETLEKYHPKDVNPATINISEGTQIVITQLKKNVSHTETYLRKRLAKRFSVIGDEFNVSINENPIDIHDRDFFKKLQFMWLLGNQPDNYSSKFDLEKVNRLSGTVIQKTKNDRGELVEITHEISGWIGSVRKPAELEEDNVNNNKISIICRGKLWQEDILKTFNESGIFSTYLIGEITADFLDTDSEEDIATSSRQSIKEDDPRFVALSEHLYQLVKEIKKVWTAMRVDAAKKTALKKATEFNPALAEWFESLNSDKSRDYAIQLFATIDTFHLSTEEEVEKKKILYAQGILAFEKLRLKENLEELNNITSIDDLRLAALFSDINEIEASMYYDIADGRIQVIREFKDKLDINDLEKSIQKHLFDNLWLLNPSWERATEGTELMEQRITTAFGKVVASLTQEERDARFDIKYRSAGGKHIVIELKRFHPTYKITLFKLADQVHKYREALRKCLEAQGEYNPHIETIIVLGEKLPNSNEDIEKVLKAVDSRVIYYDTLLEEAFKSYAAYLQRQKESSKIRMITEKILNA